MKWVTRDTVHFDRVATPWLLLRFVDPDAEFVLLPWGKENERPVDSIPFGIPGVELATHDREATSFDRVMAKYGLGSDAALVRLARIIRYGVNLLIFNEPLPPGRVGAITEGILAVIEGIMVSSATDMEVIERSLTVFDGIYALCGVEETMEHRPDAAPASGIGAAMWLTTFISAVLFSVRGKGRGFDGRTPIVEDAAFEERLRTTRSGLRAMAEEWN
jgi:hypothetical protein